MEKPATRSKQRLWKAVQAAVSFQTLPSSPRGDKRADLIAHRLKTHPNNKGFSGPIAPMIPAEARRKPKNFENQEPTSPKVSCMGQIKHKKPSLPNELKPGKIKKVGPTGPDPKRKKKKKKSGIKEIVFGAGGKSGPSTDRAKPPIRGAAPSLIQTRKFASSRDGLASFDWTAVQIAPAEDRECYSDGERGCSDGEDDFISHFSAPLMVAGAGLGLEPRKEINLWNRRAMARLKPLELNKDKEI